MKVFAERLLNIKAGLLELEGDELIEAHGLVVGIMIALERRRAEVEGRWTLSTDTDMLIRELRESTGPL